ncbi:MAG TPA: S9 family peptidase [Gemmatimonadaceae bacterium]|nr:S9 family peptidase [Gemmatimonadaceae bacterium]
MFAIPRKPAIALTAMLGATAALPLAGGTVTLAAPLAAQAPSRRPIRPADVYNIRSVGDPQLSPDGKWVAYSVSSVDSAKDRNVSHIWMTSWDGTHTIQATTSNGSESSPHWSPDGRYLSFLSSRGGADGSQLWLMNRLGGEAEMVSHVKGGISEYAWSPDGKRLVFVVTDPDSAGSDSTSPPKPIVIDRYLFKSDGSGYLTDHRDHLYLFDLATKKLEQITSGPYDDESPVWSPDGRRIAFVSARGPDPDRTGNTDIFVIEARPGASPKRLTTFAGPDDGDISWSPDGKTIAYIQGSEPKYSAYNMRHLAVVPADGGAPRVLAGDLDRSISSPLWSADGSSIYFTVADDRIRYLARIPAEGGRVQRVIEGKRVVSSPSQDAHGSIALLSATSAHPPEVFAVDGDTLRRLSHQNDGWLAGVQLATTEGISARGKDGTVVNGLLVKPASYRDGQRYPAILWIHGGPNSQDQYEFRIERELFAARGYVVFTANYRGSTGRGDAYSKSIFADWGNKEVRDLLAMADRVVAMGIADPNRLGIGGWSYGAILTNYTIASDKRFHAAVSGAGSSMQLGMYGVDEYVTQYDAELGQPWKNQEAWLKVSYPFFHADRIVTPTLFMGGDKDFNVPLVGGEQMYQALRSSGVQTELVIYPGQHHAIRRPTFQIDRLERYVAWYDKHLGGNESAAAR